MPDLAHGTIAPSLKDKVWSGTIASGSIKNCVPKPSQSGQAPNGLLKENNRGSISSIVKPETGHAKREENTIFSSSSSLLSAISATAMPSVSCRAISILSAIRLPRSGLTTIRSTTTSMSCLNFLSSVGTSEIS